MSRLAFGPGTSTTLSSVIGASVSAATRIGSTRRSDARSAISRDSPFGERYLLPQANIATTTGKKSRPFGVSTYSYHCGFL